MPTLMPWITAEIGDLDVFAPALPSLVVYTWYVDDEPESTVTYFWRDDPTGMIHYELVLVAPAPFEEAVTRAQEEAPKRNVERIHVKHARSSKKPERTAKTKRAAKISVAQSKKRAPVKRKTSSEPEGVSNPPEATIDGRLRPAAPIVL
jgi:hypothetical protein